MTAETPIEERLGAELAKCKGCGQSTKHNRIIVGTADEGYYEIPVWHSECIPEEKKSGPSWTEAERKKQHLNNKRRKT